MGFLAAGRNHDSSRVEVDKGALSRHDGLVSVSSRGELTPVSSPSVRYVLLAIRAPLLIEILSRGF